MKKNPISIEHPEIDPGDCDGNCDNCPIDKECDHIRLTDSQKFSALVCGCCFVILFFLFVTGGVIAITKFFMENQ